MIYVNIDALATAGFRYFFSLRKRPCSIICTVSLSFSQFGRHHLKLQEISVASNQPCSQGERSKAEPQRSKHTEHIWTSWFHSSIFTKSHRKAHFETSKWNIWTNASEFSSCPPETCVQNACSHLSMDDRVVTCTDTVDMDNEMFRSNISINTESIWFNSIQFDLIHLDI